MKKLATFLLLVFPVFAKAQENTPPEAIPFWQDRTFLLLIGGAVFLIIVLIVKKIMDRRNNSDDFEEGGDYEDTDTSTEL